VLRLTLLIPFYNRAQCNFQAEYPYDLFRLGPKSCNKK
jgi:hypothetical protein